VPKRYEVRCPVHGFIPITEWERDIINQPVFQRLRQIRQLGLTDMLYPGAMHTRFEHSLGVMHLATRMFEDIWDRQHAFLVEQGFREDTKGRDRMIIRLMALLHDLGHAPFSHAAEEVMPFLPGQEGKEKKDKKSYKHEQYSAGIIRTYLKDVIEQHKENDNFGLTANDIADIIERKPAIGQRKLLWRDLIDSHLDADRADYLLRDSVHIGVEYGHYDLARLVICLVIAQDPDTGTLVLAVDEGGVHAAEGLILARYMMFTQVYFHHVRGAYDHHLAETLKELLREENKDRADLGDEKGTFLPPTTPENLKAFLDWTDWKVQGLLYVGKGGPHATILKERRHDRRVYETPEVVKAADLEELGEVRERLGDRVSFTGSPEKSWYKPKEGEIQILKRGTTKTRLVPLSQISDVVKGLASLNQRRLYVPYEKATEARRIVDDFLTEKVAKKGGPSEN